MGNRGFTRGCCQSRNLTRCLPCRYKVSLRSRQYDPNQQFINQFNYDLGTYSRPGEILYETFYLEKPYSNFNLYDHDINFYTTAGTTTRAVDTTDRISYYWYGYYEFDGAYGILNTMRYWSVMSLTIIGYRYTAQINIIIQSIYFANYKLSDGTCCGDQLDPDFEDVDNECPIPCSFKVSLTDNRFDYTTTRTILNQNISRYYIYNLTIGYFADSFAFNSRVINLKFTENTNNRVIDNLLLRNLNILPKRIYYFNNIVGTSGNIISNISINLYCSSTNGPFCSAFCNEFRNIDSCENRNVVPICLNGATDSRKCENFSANCDTNPCLNNGTCKMQDRNNLICSCPSGFSGKYCQDISCQKDCNRRGFCVAPNKCICEHPFYGDDCEFEQCLPTAPTLCKNGGFCYYDGSEQKCRCDDDRFSGKYCDIPLCNGICLNGICVNDLITNKNKCICYDGFGGDLCDKQTPTLKKYRNRALGPLLIVFAILTIIFLILIVLKYKGYIFNTNKTRMDEEGHD